MAAVIAPALLLGACAPAPLVRPLPGSPTDPQTSAASSTVPTPSEEPQACLAEAGRLTPEQQAGQLLMVGVPLSGLDEPTRQALMMSHTGAVVLLGKGRQARTDVAALSAQVRALGEADLPILVAADQEGGQIQRLQGEGFTPIPTAEGQAAMNPEALRVQAEAWGDELRKAGVSFNLAPVADVVAEDRESSNAPIGKLQRHYGSTPESVAESVVPFIRGMHAADIATSLKHFPGLGAVTTNTDFADATDTTTTIDDPSWKPFIDGIEAGASSVMISSATFSRIDPDHQAVFSRKVITDVLRGDLGFDKVVIADDLGSAESVSGIPPGERAVEFLRAGGDLVINADPTLAQEMHSAIVEAMQDQPFADGVQRSVARVLALKQSVGDVDCD